MSEKPDYHAHLDVCAQCRNNPFGLCADGARILEAEVAGEGAELADVVRENERIGVRATPDDAIVKLHKALDESVMPIGPGSIVAAPHVREALIEKGARPELFHPGQVVLVDDEPELVTPIVPAHMHAMVERLNREAVDTVARIPPRFMATAASSAAALQLQSELTTEHLLEAERKLREANVQYIEPGLAPGHYYALVRAESEMGRAVMRLRQEIGRLVRREGYGGRKARSAKRRLARIEKTFPVLVHAERMGLSKLGLVIEWDCEGGDEPHYDETRVSGGG